MKLVALGLLDKQGDKQQAANAYREFLQAWSYADRDLPQLKAARAYLSRRVANRCCLPA